MAVHPAGDEPSVSEVGAGGYPFFMAVSFVEQLSPELPVEIVHPEAMIGRAGTDSVSIFADIDAEDLGG